MQLLGGEKVSEKCQSNIFRMQERGSKFGSFFGFIRVSQTLLRVKFNFFFEAISFCRLAALTGERQRKVLGGAKHHFR